MALTILISVNKKQAVYWLSVALQIHYEPEIVEAFKIAIDDSQNKPTAKNSTLHLCIVNVFYKLSSPNPTKKSNKAILICMQFINL